MDSFTAIVARGNIILRRDSPSTSTTPPASSSQANSSPASSSQASSSPTTSSLSPTMIDLIIALMVLIFVALCLIGALYIVRKIRRSRAIARQSLPQYESSSPNIHRHTRSNSRQLTISTSGGYGNNRSSVFVYDEKSSMMNARDKEMGLTGECSPTDVPEIRITFPDEQDEAGRRKSGRVVVVRVTDTGVGLEPLRDEKEEQLPAYEKEMGGRFQSIDMERIGGLKEKSEWS